GENSMRINTPVGASVNWAWPTARPSRPTIQAVRAGSSSTGEISGAELAQAAAKAAKRPAKTGAARQRMGGSLICGCVDTMLVCEGFEGELFAAFFRSFFVQQQIETGDPCQTRPIPPRTAAHPFPKAFRSSPSRMN